MGQVGLTDQNPPPRQNFVTAPLGSAVPFPGTSLLPKGLPLTFPSLASSKLPSPGANGLIMARTLAKVNRIKLQGQAMDGSGIISGGMLLQHAYCHLTRAFAFRNKFTILTQGNAICNDGLNANSNVIPSSPESL